MIWNVTAKYARPGPVFYSTELQLLEQAYPYYRVVGRGLVEARVNGVRTCYSQVTIRQYGQCGIHTLELIRHWKSFRAQTWEAKAWCERLLKNPPRYWSEKWVNDSQTLNTVCKEQMELARIGALELEYPLKTKEK